MCVVTNVKPGLNISHSLARLKSKHMYLDDFVIVWISKVLAVPIVAKKLQ